VDSDVRNELLVDVEDEGKVGEMAALALCMCLIVADGNTAILSPVFLNKAPVGTSHVLCSVISEQEGDRLGEIDGLIDAHRQNVAHAVRFFLHVSVRSERDFDLLVLDQLRLVRQDYPGII